MSKKLSLIEISKAEMSKVMGGQETYVCTWNGQEWCGCGCFYQGQGGSSTMDNCNANIDGGYESPGGGCPPEI